MQILLVEDDAILADGIARALRAEDFAVDVADNGEDGSHLGLTELYDAAVLDLGLPKRDGVSVLRDWRAEGRTLPVLILTPRDGWSEKVAGFKAGADDYLTKPFRMEEVVMRLRALVRRAAGHAGARIVRSELVFDAQLVLFELQGLPLKLTAFEWRMLSALMLRKEAVIERAELIERVYEGDADIDSSSIEVRRRASAPQDRRDDDRDGAGQGLPSPTSSTTSTAWSSTNDALPWGSCARRRRYQPSVAGSAAFRAAEGRAMFVSRRNPHQTTR